MELLTPKHPSSNLTGLVQSLSTNLATLQPNKSETTQIITYALLATAVVGIMVYHYIKDSENEVSAKQRAEDLKERIK